MNYKTPKTHRSACDNSANCARWQFVANYIISLPFIGQRVIDKKLVLSLTWLSFPLLRFRLYREVAFGEGGLGWGCRLTGHLVRVRFPIPSRSSMPKKAPGAISSFIEGAHLLNDICNPCSIQVVACFLVSATVLQSAKLFLLVISHLSQFLRIGKHCNAVTCLSGQ